MNVFEGIRKENIVKKSENFCPPPFFAHGRSKIPLTQVRDINICVLYVSAQVHGNTRLFDKTLSF